MNIPRECSSSETGELSSSTNNQVPRFHSGHMNSKGPQPRMEQPPPVNGGLTGGGSSTMMSGYSSRNGPPISNLNADAPPFVPKSSQGPVVENWPQATYDNSVMFPNQMEYSSAPALHHQYPPTFDMMRPPHPVSRTPYHHPPSSPTYPPSFGEPQNIAPQQAWPTAGMMGYPNEMVMSTSAATTTNPQMPTPLGAKVNSNVGPRPSSSGAVFGRPVVHPKDPLMMVASSIKDNNNNVEVKGLPSEHTQFNTTNEMDRTTGSNAAPPSVSPPPPPPPPQQHNADLPSAFPPPMGTYSTPSPPGAGNQQQPRYDSSAYRRQPAGRGGASPPHSRLTETAIGIGRPRIDDTKQILYSVDTPGGGGGNEIVASSQQLRGTDSIPPSHIIMEDQETQMPPPNAMMPQFIPPPRLALSREATPCNDVSNDVWLDPHINNFTTENAPVAAVPSTRTIERQVPQRQQQPTRPPSGRGRSTPQPGDMSSGQSSNKWRGKDYHASPRSSKGTPSMMHGNNNYKSNQQPPSRPDVNVDTRKLPPPAPVVVAPVPPKAAEAATPVTTIKTKPSYADVIKSQPVANRVPQPLADTPVASQRITCSETPPTKAVTVLESSYQYHRNKHAGVGKPSPESTEIPIAPPPPPQPPQPPPRQLPQYQQQQQQQQPPPLLSSSSTPKSHSKRTGGPPYKQTRHDTAEMEQHPPVSSESPSGKPPIQSHKYGYADRVKPAGRTDSEEFMSGSTPTGVARGRGRRPATASGKQGSSGRGMGRGPFRDDQPTVEEPPAHRPSSPTSFEKQSSSKSDIHEFRKGGSRERHSQGRRGKGQGSGSKQQEGRKRDESGNAMPVTSETPASTPSTEELLKPVPSAITVAPEPEQPICPEEVASPVDAVSADLAVEAPPVVEAPPAVAPLAVPVPVEVKLDLERQPTVTESIPVIEEVQTDNITSDERAPKQDNLPPQETPQAIPETPTASSVEENVVAKTYGLPMAGALTETTPFTRGIVTGANISSMMYQYPESPSNGLATPISTAFRVGSNNLASNNVTRSSESRGGERTPVIAREPSSTASSLWPEAVKSGGRTVWKVDVLMSVRGFPECLGLPHWDSDGMERVLRTREDDIWAVRGEGMGPSYLGSFERITSNQNLQSIWDTEIGVSRRGRTDQHYGESSSIGGPASGSQLKHIPSAHEITRRPAPAIAEISKDEFSQRQKDEKDSGDRILLLTRKLRALLNKLSLEKFDAVYAEMLGAGVQREDLGTFIPLIIEKATMQHKYTQMYAELCQRLQQDLYELDTNQPEPPSSASSSSSPNVQSSSQKRSAFRRLMLEECQSCFENTLKEPEFDATLSKEDKFEKSLLYKTRINGNLKFVGELLKRKILAQQAGMQICNKLLQNGGPIQLEALACFLQIVVPLYQDKPFFKDIKSQIETQVFKNSETPFRVICLLQDALDQRLVRTEEPTTLDEVKFSMPVTEPSSSLRRKFADATPSMSSKLR